MGRPPLTSKPRSRLEEIRRYRGIRAAILAELIGIDPSHLHRIERGSYGLTPRWRDKLAAVLSVPVEQLYAPIGSPIPFDTLTSAAMDQLLPRPYDPMHVAQAIGARLTALMQDCGLTTAEALAEAIGATVPQVVDWLEGRTKPPLPLMNRLANRTGVTLAWIYYGDETGLLPRVAERLRRG